MRVRAGPEAVENGLKPVGEGTDGEGGVSVDLLSWAVIFVSTSSVSHEGNHAIAERAAELLREAGLVPRLESVELAGTTYRAVLADLGPAAAADTPGLLLVTHLDTVPPGDPATWTATGGDPLRPTRDGDRLYGLGAADAKVDFVCKVAALAEIDPQRLTRGLRIVGTFGEEIGLLGTRWLVESGRVHGFRYALVGEPSELVAIHAHKGYAVFDARVALEPLTSASGVRVIEECFQGHSVHSSTPELGSNAIELALERLAAPDARGFAALNGGGAVNKVPESARLELGIESADDEARGELYAAQPLLAFHQAWRRLLEQLAAHRDTEFDPDHTVGSLGRVEMREGAVVFGFDLRPIPGIDPEQAVQPLAQVAELECRLRNPPLATPLDSPLVRAVAAAREHAGLRPALATKGTCTEAGLLAQAGLEALILGAGPSVGNVHRPNEYTRISELAQARDIYRYVIESLCIRQAARCSS